MSDTLQPATTAEDDSALDVSFFIPCHNEEANVTGAIEKLVDVCATVGLTYEVLVYDDASTDRTSDVVREWQRAHPHINVRLFTLDKNAGVARNFVDGAFNARGRHYRLVCGDDIEPKATHEAILRELGKADVIVPYFTEIRNRPWHRTVISRTYTRLVNFASGYRLRYYNGCPMFKRRDVLRYHVENTGFGYQAEFLTRLIYEGKTYREVPLIAFDREGSTSINLKNLLSVANSLVIIALRRLRIVLFE